MRKIIEKHGKFYVEETRIVGEITLTALEDQLAEIKAQKESTLAAKAAEFEGRISEVESQIEQVTKFQEKPAETPQEPGAKKAADTKAPKTKRRKSRKTG